ncbi:MAG: hypothetical protein IPH84_05580 [Bacteroidales bacterium]|nr:hypothetical protein [Bacteroidales bacterium]
MDTINNILYVTTIGDIDLENMLNGVSYLEQAEDLPRDLKVLEDATSSKAVFKVSDIEIITERLDKVVKKYSSIRHAVVHSDPTNTAYTILASMMIKHPNYSLKVFSTKDAAKHWLTMFP